MVRRVILWGSFVGFWDIFWGLAGLLVSVDMCGENPRDVRDDFWKTRFLVLTRFRHFLELQFNWWIAEWRNDEIWRFMPLRRAVLTICKVTSCVRGGSRKKSWSKISKFCEFLYPQKALVWRERTLVQVCSGTPINTQKENFFLFNCFFSYIITKT